LGNPVPGGSKYRNLAFQVVGVSKIETIKYVHESRGTGCSGDVRKKLKSTDPTSRQRGRPTSANSQLSKNYQREKGKNWSRVPDGCLTPRRTGRLTVGRNITLILTLLGESNINETLGPARAILIREGYHF
jgi:hypothetical protein